MHIIRPDTVLTLEDLNQFKGNPFESMIKYVVDIKNEVLAIGGEMHADAEKILLEQGSEQDDLWGANIYPWEKPYKIECTSLINIRPHIGNKSMEILDENTRNRVKNITLKWISFK